ncbi:hypothetical protein SANTM175S_02553 [Streptomyces antimycoticus]
MTSRFCRSTIAERTRHRSASSCMASAMTAISAVPVSGRSSSAPSRITTASTSACRLPRSVASRCSSKTAAIASTTSSHLLAQRR